MLNLFKSLVAITVFGVGGSLMSHSGDSLEASVSVDSGDGQPFILPDGDDSDEFDFMDIPINERLSTDMQWDNHSEESDTARRIHPVVPNLFEQPYIAPGFVQSSILVDSDDDIKHRVHTLTLFPIPLFPPSMIGATHDPVSPTDRAPVGHPVIQRAFLVRAIHSGITTWHELAVLLGYFCTTNPFLGLPYHQLIGQLLFPDLRLTPRFDHHTMPVA